jgi:hypothetical protein
VESKDLVGPEEKCDLMSRRLGSVGSVYGILLNVLAAVTPDSARRRFGGVRRTHDFTISHYRRLTFED